MPLGSRGKARDELEKLYRKLNGSLDQITAFRRKHRGVLDEWEELLEAKESVQERIKALCYEVYARAARGAKVLYAGSNIKVIVTPKRERSVNIDALLAAHEDKLRDLGVVIDEHVEPKTVDISALDKAVYKKAFDGKLLQQFTSYGESMTPSVSFKQPDPAKPDDTEE